MRYDNVLEADECLPTSNDVAISDRSTDVDGWRWYGEPGPESPISCTTILGQTVANPKLANWYKKTTEKKIDETVKKAATFGGDAHALFEQVLNNKLGEVPESHKGHVTAFTKWVSDHNVKAIQCEIPLVSRKYGYAGTADFLGEIDGKVVIADWKTGRSYDIKTGWQIAAYRMAAIEMGLVGESCGMIGVSIPRDNPSVKMFVYEHIDFCEHAFRATLDVFKALHFGKLNKLNWKWLKERAV